MIDLHCHILPDIDDGPADLEASVRMVRAALDDGIHTIVATPHVNLRYGSDPAAIGALAEDLQAQLDQRELPLSLLAGAEIALSRLPGIDDELLRALCLGTGSYVLLESPYGPTGSLIEESVFDLRVRGFRPVLAHPERCPEFRRDPPRLGRLVESGAACSISAGSVVGRFGEQVRRFARRLLEAGLVHSVSSDAHDPVTRPPALSPAFRARKGPLRDAALREWLTRTVPAAMLADEDLPARPPLSSTSRWRRPAARG